MRTRDLNFFRRLLEGRKREILDEAERALGSMNPKAQDHDRIADPADRATLESDRNLLLRIRDRERKLLAKINAAFARIDKGDYGLCEECGQEIGLARLKARPVTTLCITCKSAQEARERLGYAR
ncbi:MAG TPA: RNA polymerase-binding protein DksA [Candidatus Binataceae bacterium]|nr:RNA polymerase-binding protein DksA [Candidatus Binataceae bacterium]